MARLLSPHELTNWVHVTLRHDLPSAERLAKLDDVYEMLDSCTDPRHDDIDAMVMAEVRCLIGDPAREA
ncbi:hypothetical protein ACFQ1S_07305 [Kibdelosporangium lantanae]|uniref:Uncharacterized protein n=1 Tax=Kibdelosporangium lantanae TaxID=1497396 RepID=A0ABW3M4E7_9PSEU